MTKPLIAFQPSFDIRASDFFRHWSLVIGHSTGHGPTARQKRKEAVSTNLPGNRIAAWLWKAALKTHALQTLGDGRGLRTARSVWSASDLSALSVRLPRSQRGVYRKLVVDGQRPLAAGCHDTERQMNLYVGTSGYSYKEWKGTFYPDELPDKQMLRFYGERFRSVEINNTFYRMPKASVLETWAAEVPADFKFVLKASQRITHKQRLKDAGDSVSYLLEVAGVLKDRLGPLLFQLPPFLQKDAPRLRDFLALLPTDRRAAFEFRHQSWFDDEIFSLLRDRQAALCIAEAENDLEIPFESTADWGYLRLRRPDYGDPELKTWGKRVRQKDWRDAFVFFKHEEEGKGPQMAKRFLELTA